MARDDKYRKEIHPAAMIEAGKLGKSFVQFAAEHDIVKQTVYDWEKKHPEFAEAKKLAKLHAENYWMQEGERGMWGGKQFNPGVWIYWMKCRFSNWREDQKVAHDIKVQKPLFDPEKMTKEEYIAAVSGAHPKRELD